MAGEIVDELGDGRDRPLEDEAREAAMLASEAVSQQDAEALERIATALQAFARRECR